MQLVELSKLSQHEEADPMRLNELKEEIKLDGILKLAIAVDINTNIILDGEHRFNILKELGCKKIPAVFVDYNSPDIKVQAWRKGEQLTKNDIIEAGFSEKKLNSSITAFILASVSYRTKNNTMPISQRNIAEEIAKFREAQEVHIITGDWDLLIKLKAENVDAIGEFVIDKLRLVKGIERTLTCMVFETCKETTEIPITDTEK